MGRQSSRVCYDFSRFRLDPSARTLALKSNGELIPLTSRGFDTLLYLIEHRGQLIDKATLMDAVWPNSVVEENNLHQSLSAIRRALGERPGENSIIINVPRRGYQFVGDVSVINAETRESVNPSQLPTRSGFDSRRVTRRVAAISTCAVALVLGAYYVLASKRLDVSPRYDSIAVMPFANANGDPNSDYLADGIAEELIHMLGGVGDLSVTARTSTFAYKGRATDARKIAQDLGVDAVLEGSVHNSGSRLRVNARLIEGRTGYQVWSHTYDREPASGSELAAISAQPNAEAHRKYLLASALIARPKPENLESAIELLNEVIEQAPDFARAYYARGNARFLMKLWYAAPIAISDAAQDAQRALSLEPRMSRAHALLGQLKIIQGRWFEAETHLHRAVALGPTDAENHGALGRLELHTGHIAKALRSAHRAFELAPAEPIYAVQLSVAYGFAGDDQKSKELLDLATTLGWERTARFAGGIRGMQAMRAGRYEEAEHHVIHGLTPPLQTPQGHRVVKVYYGVLAGSLERDTAVAALLELENAMPRSAMCSMGWFFVWRLSSLDAVDAAFDIAESTLGTCAREDMLGNTASPEQWLPESRAFRQHARYQAFVNRVGLLEYWLERGAPDGCTLRERTVVCGSS